MHHSGEEYIYVLEGPVEIHTEFYEPIVLQAGESIYIDAHGPRLRRAEGARRSDRARRLLERGRGPDGIADDAAQRRAAGEGEKRQAADGETLSARMQRPRIAWLAALTLFAPLAQAAESVAAPPVESCPDNASASRAYSFFLAGNRAGYHLECRMPDGSGLYIFEFNDRGRGPSVRSRIVQDAAGIPTVITVDGNDYLKNEIAERFSIEKGKAAWKNKVEQGDAERSRRPRST